MDTLSTTIQTDRLQTEMDAFLGHYNFWELRQISLTSLTGDDDWTCSVGSALALQKPERMYSQLNKYFSKIQFYFQKIIMLNLVKTIYQI
jgi:hypothetical protein